MDRLAAAQVDHLPPAETRGAGGANFACVTDDDLVSRADFARRVDHADREDVALREEVLDLDPIRVLLREDRAAVEGEGQHPPARVHRHLAAPLDDTDVREATAERRSVDEGSARLAELEARDVPHLLRELGPFRHALVSRRRLVQRVRERGEGFVRRRAFLRRRDGIGQPLPDDRHLGAEVGDHGVVPIRPDVGPEVVRYHGGLVPAPVPRDGDVVRAGGVEALELPGDEAERRRDDHLVHDGGILRRQDRIAEATVAPTQGVRLAGGARQQEEDPRGGRLRVAVPHPTPEPDDLRPGERLARVREELAAGDGGVWLEEIVPAEVEMPHDGGVPWCVRETTFDELPQPSVGEVVPDQEHLPEQRAFVVGCKVLPRRTRGTAARLPVRLALRQHAVSGVEESSDTVEPDAARIDDVASPVTARTFPGPSSSRTRCTAATKSRGERSNSGPLARKAASAAFAAPTSESLATIARSPTGPEGGMSRSAIDAGTPFVGGRSSGWPEDWGANRLPLTRICGRGSAVRSRTKSPSAYSGALREGRSTNRTIGMANERPPRCHSAVRPRPPRWRISSIDRTRMPAARHKAADLTGRVSFPRNPKRRRATAARSGSIERRRVALDQCEFLRLERTVVDAQDDGRAVQRDLLVDVLQEVQDPREVVVDHEVLDPVQEDHRPRAVAHEVPDEVAEAVQVVRVDVVLAEGRRQPDDADVAVPAATEDVVRVLAGDVHRPPPGVDRLVEVAQAFLRLAFLDEVGATFFEVLLLPEEQVPEKFVLLEREQERPQKPPHVRNRLTIRRSVFIRMVSRIEGESYSRIRRVHA